MERPADRVAGRPQETSEQNDELTGSVNKDARFPRATHQAPVYFGDIAADGYVLPDGTACLSKRGVLHLLTGSEQGELPRLVRRIPAPPPKSGQIASSPSENAGGSPPPNLPSVRFLAGANNAVVDGITADTVVDLFQRYIDALGAGLLRADQVPLAMRAAVVLGAVAREGMKLAIYAATGANEYLARQLVQDRIAVSLLREASKWREMFSPEFFLALAKVCRVEASRGGKRPGIFAWFIGEYFYEYFDTCVHAEIKLRNPDPTRGTKHHQFLTPLARAAFTQHERDVTMLLTSSSSLTDFKMRFDAVFRGQQLMRL